jgi:PhzF family phenazine biosynthesis protein
MRQWLVDAFAAAPFRGNPAAVVAPFDVWPTDAWMQALAQENNQAETAFLLKTDDPARFGLRWFTPAVEVPLCGHATLASAHVLIDELGVEPSVAFDTRSGRLSVKAVEKGRYAMDFPSDPPHRIAAPAGLEDVLGAPLLEVWAASFLVVILGSEAAVRDLRPDIERLKTIRSDASKGPGALAVAALANPGAPYHVVSRFFAPGMGIVEDPATGSLHCILSPLFSDKVGRDDLSFHQAYPGRGGDIQAKTIGPRVVLTGRAVTIWDARLRL